jgi:ribosomal protein S12 methylthiotransferase
MPVATLTADDGGQPRVALVALGCPKNLVDAEQMLGVLTARGYRLVPDPARAEVIVVNTCGFLQAAREEALREIRAAARLKHVGRCDTLVVTGCLAQADPDGVRAHCSEVDAVIGVAEFARIGELVDAARAGRRDQVAVSAPVAAYRDELPRTLATAPWTAYLKIAEGCDCRCSFCTIPALRGPFRSRPLESVVTEAERLVAGGVRELVLVAEDVTHYGRDRAGAPRLADLLRALGALDRLDWIRLLYCYPTRLDDALLAAMAEVPAVLPYVDMPLQHAHDGILSQMHRAGNRAGYLRLLARLREALPDVCVRSSFIVGFPGERREEFAALESFLEEARLDRVGFFAFSPEPGTPAATLPGRVAPGVARARIARLAERQAAISQQGGNKMVGRSLAVLVESGTREGGVGRSYRDAPEIDGVVHVDGAARGALRPGEMVRVRITAADTHDLFGSVHEDQVSP